MAHTGAAGQGGDGLGWDSFGMRLAQFSCSVQPERLLSLCQRGPLLCRVAGNA